MGQYVLLLVVALTVGAIVFGVTVLVSGGDPGLDAAEPDGRAVPLPGTRPLVEADVTGVRFDTAVRGYRMAQVDHALHRVAYDIGYKDELISVLEAEVAALRDGRTGDAEVLRRAREAALAPAATTPATPAAAPAATTPVTPAVPAAAAPAALAPASPAVQPVAPALDPPVQEPVQEAEPAGQGDPVQDAEPADAAERGPAPGQEARSADGSVDETERAGEPAPSGDRR